MTLYFHKGDVNLQSLWFIPSSHSTSSSVFFLCGEQCCKYVLWLIRMLFPGPGPHLLPPHLHTHTRTHSVDMGSTDAVRTGPIKTLKHPRFVHNFLCMFTLTQYRCHARRGACQHTHTHTHISFTVQVICSHLSQSKCVLFYFPGAHFVTFLNPAKNIFSLEFGRCS